jgi:GNAT superfamily N-acetyltransferase
VEGPVVVELVGAPVVAPLRRAVLRPGRPAPESRYPADDHPDTAHVALRVTDQPQPDGPVAVGTVLPEPPPWEPARSDGWRIRGMATRADLRGHGLGRLVLDALVDHVAARGGGVLWCNARVTATGFYRRAGFVTRGAVFDVPGIGPHHHMWRTVGPRRLGRGAPPVPT